MALNIIIIKTLVFYILSFCSVAVGYSQSTFPGWDIVPYKISPLDAVAKVSTPLFLGNMNEHGYLMSSTGLAYQTPSSGNTISWWNRWGRSASRIVGFTMLGLSLGYTSAKRNGSAHPYLVATLVGTGGLCFGFVLSFLNAIPIFFAFFLFIFCPLFRAKNKNCRRLL